MTAARLRLVPAPRRSGSSPSSGVGSIAEAVALAGHVRRTVADVDAVEFLTDACRAARRRRRCRSSGEHAVYVLVECAGHDDPTPALAAAVGDLPAAVAGPAEPGRRAELWRHREAITEAVNAIGPPVKLDVTLPGADAGRVLRRGRRRSCPPAPRLWLFGHVADGNVHVNVTGVDPADESVDDAVLRLVADHGGSISAEHGIGRAKRRWLHLVRTPAEIAAFAAIKHALDPQGILNPGVLLPDP